MKENYCVCKKCGGNFPEKEMVGYICNKCIDKYRNDFKKCYEISKDDMRNVKINGIFVSLLGNAIEEILEEYIKNELPNIDCSGYIDEDIYWFSDKILEEVSE